MAVKQQTRNKIVAVLTDDSLKGMWAKTHPSPGGGNMSSRGKPPYHPAFKVETKKIRKRKKKMRNTDRLTASVGVEKKFLMKAGARRRKRRGTTMSKIPAAIIAIWYLSFMVFLTFE